MTRPETNVQAENNWFVVVRDSNPEDKAEEGELMNGTRARDLTLKVKQKKNTLSYFRESFKND